MDRLAVRVGISLLLLAALHVLASGYACSGATTAVGTKEEGEACTRSTECMSHLTCRAGVCRPVSDASVDGDANSPPGAEPE
jgi:hypothetical protein